VAVGRALYLIADNTVVRCDLDSWSISWALPLHEPYGLAGKQESEWVAVSTLDGVVALGANGGIVMRAEGRLRGTDGPTELALSGDTLVAQTNSIHAAPSWLVGRDRTGDLLWEAGPLDGTATAPVIVGDEVVHVVSIGSVLREVGEVRAYETRTGKLSWRRRVRAQPVLGDRVAQLDGWLVYGPDDDLDPARDDEVLWIDVRGRRVFPSRIADGGSPLGPPIAGDGMVVFLRQYGDHDGLVAVDANTRNEKWRVSLHGSMTSNAAAIHEGNVYLRVSTVGKSHRPGDGAQNELLVLAGSSGELVGRFRGCHSLSFQVAPIPTPRGVIVVCEEGHLLLCPDAPGPGTGAREQ